MQQSYHERTASNAPSVEFKPSASVLARAWLETVEGRLTWTGLRVGRIFAEEAGFARSENRRRHLAAGDVALFWRQEELATKHGISVTTLQRGLRDLTKAGLIRERTGRASTIIFPNPKPSAALEGSADGSGEGSDLDPVSDPSPDPPANHCAKHSEGGGGVRSDEPPRVRRPDAPATPKQRQTIEAICQRRGLCLPWQILGVDRRRPFTRGEASQFITDQDRAGKVRRVYHATAPPTEEQIDILADRDLPSGDFTRATAAAAIEGGLRGAGVW